LVANLRNGLPQVEKVDAFCGELPIVTEISLIHLQADGISEDSSATIALPYLPFVLGRHPTSDRPLQDAAISRRHCAFYYHDGRVWVEDLGSINGTRLNGEWLAEARPLADGDHLQLAQQCFRVCLPKIPPPQPRAEPRARAREIAGALLSYFARRSC
jgi:predicted component of type VI protein secretion system